MKKALAAGLMAATALTSVVAVSSPAEAADTCSHAKFQRVQHGMSVARVQHIMGSRGHLEYKSDYTLERTWGSYRASLCDITFWREYRREPYRVEYKSYFA